MKRLSLIAALVLGGLIAGNSMALAQDAKQGKEGRKGRGASVEQQLQRMDTELKLTDSQKPKIKAVLEEGNKKRQELMSDTATPREERGQKMRTLMQDQNKKLKEILTAEQFAKWEKAREEMRKNRGGEQKRKT